MPDATNLARADREIRVDVRGELECTAEVGSAAIGVSVDHANCLEVEHALAWTRIVPDRPARSHPAELYLETSA